MTKSEKVKQWLEQSGSYDGCIYIAVDRNGNSFSRIHSARFVTERQLVGRMKRVIEDWDEELPFVEQKVIQELAPNQSHYKIKMFSVNTATWKEIEEKINAFLLEIGDVASTIHCTPDFIAVHYFIPVNVDN